MTNRIARPRLQEEPSLMIALGISAIVGCLLFVGSILVADVVVPDHYWIADTISDLGAGRYEFIVDIGIYAFSASLVMVALLGAHVHMGGWGWSFGILGFATLGLIVFLVGARNEYGDNDSEGIVIHTYLVYVLGLLFAATPLAMAKGAGRAGKGYARSLVGLALLWIVSAPIFFFLPDRIDGIYERYLGVIAMAMVIVFARFFIGRGRMH